MHSLIKYLKSKTTLTIEDEGFILKYFTAVNLPAKKSLLTAGETERHLYFLSKGIVRGYQIINGKIVVEHLVDENNFFASFESFINQSPSVNYFETITDCILFKIAKPDLAVLKNHSKKLELMIEAITHEHLQCKMERVRDFQQLTAKERYLKFLEKTPSLALKVSVENMASYLGIEPQSLSRIRKQITS